MNKKADMGIGTLIIFIAMILVAAIAAGVLIQTATSLQNRALLTGTRTQGQVSTALQYLAVYAENGSSPDKTVEDFFINAKLAAGSDAIKLEDALLELSLQDTSANLNYAGNEFDCEREPGDPENSGYYTEDNAGNFSVEYLVQGNEGLAGYLESGDVVRFCIMSPRPVGPDEDIHIRFIPQVGNPAVMETSIPDTITQTRVHIFP